MKHKIEITETLQRIIEVEAETLTEAICKIGALYSDGEIVLDEADFVGFDIGEYKEAQNEKQT